LWPLWLLLGIIVLIKYVLYFLEKHKLSKSSMSEVDKMDGRTFEIYLESLFEKLGYKVDRTKYVGDYGADLVTYKNGIKTVIQAKR
jgi:restriction system protein